MLNCNLCNYIKSIQKSEDVDFCNKYLCEFSNETLTEEDIFNLCIHPCYHIKQR